MMEEWKNGVSGIKYQVPGSRFQVPGFKFQVPGFKTRQRKRQRQRRTPEGFTVNNLRFQPEDAQPCHSFNVV
jgi:hypothetical protein